MGSESFLAPAFCYDATNFSSTRRASSQLNRGSRMRRLIAALVFCLLNIPVLAEDCVASVYAVGDSSQPGTKTASGIPLDALSRQALPYPRDGQPLNFEQARRLQHRRTGPMFESEAGCGQQRCAGCPGREAGPFGAAWS